MTALLSFICRIILSGIFLLAGLAKIPDPASFLLTMRGFRIFPDLLERFLAVYIPWLELILGLCLLADVLHLPDAADYKAVIRNLVFLGMALTVFFIQQTRFSLNKLLRTRAVKGDRLA